MRATSARLLRLLSLLQTRKDWPGAELADRLEVSARTVRRDVDRLRELGYPIRATMGTGGGYQLGAGASLPPLLLEDDEAVAVAVGLRTAVQGGVSRIEESSTRALAKLLQVLPSRLRRRVGALGSFTVSVPECGPSADADVLALVASACRDGERLRFDYERYDGTSSRRVVEPHRLVFREQRWYLVAWDNEREDWRTFRVDRMVPRLPTGPRVPRREPPEQDVVAYLNERMTWHMWRYKARVRLSLPFEEARRTISSYLGQVEPVEGDPDRCLLLCAGSDLRAMACYLGMLGLEMEIEEPAELREEMARTAARFQRAAQA